MLGRSYLAMKAGFERCLSRLPFPVLELHPDNGPEFVQQHLVRFFGDAIPGLHLSRSRPYQKERQPPRWSRKTRPWCALTWGFDRLDTVEQTVTLNQLMTSCGYTTLLPARHALEPENYHPTLKVSPPMSPAATTRPQTPSSACVPPAFSSDDQRHELQALRDRTNPRQLRPRDLRLL